MKTVQVILFGLLLSFSVLNGAQFDCNISQNMEAGKTYIYNSEFPYYYTGERACNWKINSPSDIKINCTLEMIGWPQHFSIQFANGKIVYFNCDKYSCFFNIPVITGRNPIITLNSVYNSQSRFLCEIQTDTSEDCICGQKKVTRIVGGKETGINEYPMMSGLVDVEEEMIFCGSTIISPQHVLTAAHCIDNRDINKIGVVVGEHDTTTGSDTNATKLFRVKRWAIHPGYRSDKNADNDIAICTVDGTIEYSAEVGPVCLPFQHKRDSFAGSIVTALGWGLLEFAGGKPTKLQKVDLNVMTLTKCKTYYSSDAMNDTNMCTFTWKKDTCQMDSGGPLLWQNPTTKNLVLVGIISSGVGCASTKPAISMKVGAYVDWIASETPDVQYCQIE